MPDTIKFNGDILTVKRKLSFGEVKTAQHVVGSLIGMDEEIKKADNKDLPGIAKRAMDSTEEQMELVSNTLINCLGFDQEKLNTISYPDAVVLFNEVFKSSTEVKKKLEQPYG